MKPTKNNTAARAAKKARVINRIPRRPSMYNTKDIEDYNPSIQLMGKGSKLSFRNIPSSTQTTQNEPTWLRMEGRVTHPELGGGVRIAGRQILCNITTTAGDSQLFATNGATVATINSIYLSPDTLNGRLALQARAYDRYIFRKVKLTYVPRVPTTQAGSFAIGYVGDSSFPSPTFATVTSMSPAMQTSFYGDPRSVTIVDDLRSDKFYYTLIDATSAGSLRQTVQGAILGAPDATSIGATFMGTMWIDYLIDLYQPTQDQGFTLRLTEDEQRIVTERRRLSALPSTSDASTEIASLQQRIDMLRQGK